MTSASLVVARSPDRATTPTEGLRFQSGSVAHCVGWVLLAVSYLLAFVGPAVCWLTSTNPYPNHPRAESSVKAGVWRIFSKPLELPSLFALVDEAVNKR